MVDLKVVDDEGEEEDDDNIKLLQKPTENRLVSTLTSSKFTISIELIKVILLFVICIVVGISLSVRTHTTTTTTPASPATPVVPTVQNITRYEYMRDVSRTYNQPVDGQGPTTIMNLMKDDMTVRLNELGEEGWLLISKEIKGGQGHWYTEMFLQRLK